MRRLAQLGLVCLAALAACSSPADVSDPAADDFLVGGDVSFLPEIEDLDGTYSDDEGDKELIGLLRDHGFNAIRLKLWHTPERPYNNLDQVLRMARRIDEAGLGFLLDFHYSDWWADPGKQIKPAAWEGLEFDVLVDSVYRYSYDVIDALRAQGTVPSMVQIGNEIRTGMLWPDGRVDGEHDTPEQWDHLAALLDAGRRGVLDAAGDVPPRIMIHFDNGAKNEMGRYFYDNLVARGLEFDAIGLSFYSKWHGSLDELRANLPDLSARYDKDIYVVETAYPWTLDWHDEAPNIFGTEEDLHEGYPPTVDGQSAFLSEVRSAVEAVPGGRGRGIFYWAPEWIPVEGIECHWENAALFDFNGRALPGLDALAGRDAGDVPIVTIDGPAVIAFWRHPESDSVLDSDPAFATALDDIQYYGVQSGERLAELNITYLDQPGLRFRIRNDDGEKLFAAAPDSSDVGYLLVTPRLEYKTLYRVQYPDDLLREAAGFLDDGR